MKRQTLRYVLVFCLLASAAFAAWTWLRPYAWARDPRARGEVVSVLVTQDQAYYWVNVHWKANSGPPHNLQKKVCLETSHGVKIEPADTTLVGSNEKMITEIWWKFWLNSENLDGFLTLRVNDGSLSIKSESGIPELGKSNYRNFTTNQW